MGKASGVIGLLISLQLMVARILVITEELIMPSSAISIVGFRLRYCMWYTDVIQNMDTVTKLLGLSHLSSRYHVPRSWLKETANTLVLFEEIGGDPTQISFVTRQVSDKAGRNLGSTLSLGCPSHDQVISKINFASFGTPVGTSGNFSHGPCGSRRALSTLRKVRVPS